jgi:hypothetical protein
VPIVITASVLVARRGVAPARAFAMGALGILFIVAPLLYALAVARHRESFSAVIPVLVFALIVSILWPYRRTA